MQAKEELSKFSTEDLREKVYEFEKITSSLLKEQYVLLLEEIGRRLSGNQPPLRLGSEYFLKEEERLRAEYEREGDEIYLGKPYRLHKEFPIYEEWKLNFLAIEQEMQVYADIEEYHLHEEFESRVELFMKREHSLSSLIKNAESKATFAQIIVDLELKMLKANKHSRALLLKLFDVKALKSISSQNKVLYWAVTRSDLLDDVAVRIRPSVFDENY
jgi:hypothetical protein